MWQMGARKRLCGPCPTICNKQGGCGPLQPPRPERLWWGLHTNDLNQRIYKDGEVASKVEPSKIFLYFVEIMGFPS